MKAMTGCLTRVCTAVIARPVLRLHQVRLRSSVARPSWTMRLRKVPRPDLAALLLPQPDQGLFILPHDDSGIGAANKMAVGRFVLKGSCHPDAPDVPASC